MPERRTVLLTLAGPLLTLGVAVLIFKATWRSEIGWWADPTFWIGAIAVTAGALIFVWLLVPPWITERQARRERREQLLHEGRANQRQGLDEMAHELGQISRQLKSELRWGKRGGLFPNGAWVKNQHLVTGDIRTLVDSAYEQAHLLDEATLAATQEELDKQETEQRQRVKLAVDTAAETVRHLRDEVPP